MWSLQSSAKLTEKTCLQVNEAFDRLLKKGHLDFLNEDEIQLSIDQCRKHSSFFKDKKHLIVIGLGGSSLGTKALCHGLFENWSDKIFFLDNVDSHQIDRFLKKSLDWEKAGWLVVSKSGKTIETLSLYNYCHSFLFKKHSLSIIEKTVVITSPGKSPLHNFAVKNKCPLLLLPSEVSGRFSVFTVVGLFPLIFMGEDIGKLKKCGSNILENKKQVIELASQLWVSQLRGETNFYSFQYCERLVSWSFWLQQLWSESLSKSKNLKGQTAPINSTFVPCRGVSDQHSVLQQIVEGPEKKIVLFHRVEESETSLIKTSLNPIRNPLMDHKELGTLLGAELLSTQKTIQDSGHETLCLSTETLTLESFSELMTLWMFVVVVLGELYNINTFNQPGVESGKKETCSILMQKTNL